jgi:hypothetical protein
MDCPTDSTDRPALETSEDMIEVAAEILLNSPCFCGSKQQAVWLAEDTIAALRDPKNLQL